MRRACIVAVVGVGSLLFLPGLGGAVAVKIVDPGGTPVAETQIKLDDQTAKTDDQGRVDIPPGTHTIGGGALTKRVEVPSDGGTLVVQRFTALSGQFPPGLGTLAVKLGGEFGTSPRVRLHRDRQETDIGGTRVADHSTRQQIEEFNNDRDVKDDSALGKVHATIGLGTFPIFGGALFSLAGDIGVGGGSHSLKQRSRSDASSNVTIDVNTVDYSAGLKGLLQFFPAGWPLHPFIEGGIQFGGANGSGDRSVRDILAAGATQARNRSADYFQQDYSAWIGAGASVLGDRVAPYAIAQFMESDITTRVVNDFTVAGLAARTKATAEFDLSPAHRVQFGGGVKVFPITKLPLILNVQALTDSRSIEVTANAAWVINIFGR